MAALWQSCLRALGPKYEAQKKVYTMGFGFSALFTAYKAAEQLQTAINGDSGYTCLLAIYILFTCSSVVAPLLVGKLGPRHLMWISGLPYVAISASYMFPKSQVMLMTSCVTVGIAAATLWSSEGSYMGISAQEMAKESGMALTDCTSSLNGTFFAVFSFSGILSASCVAITMALVPNSIRPLFGGLTAIGFLGVLILASLKDPREKRAAGTLTETTDVDEGGIAMLECGPADAAVQLQQEQSLAKDLSAKAERATAEFQIGEAVVYIRRDGCKTQAVVVSVDHSLRPPSYLIQVDGAERETEQDRLEKKPPEVSNGDPEVASVGYMLCFLVRDAKIGLLNVTMFVSGMRWGFFIGSFQASIVAPVAGLWFVPVTGVLIGVVTSVASLVWQSLVLRPSFGRRSAIFITFALQAFWSLALAAWCHARLPKRAFVESTPAPQQLVDSEALGSEHSTAGTESVSEDGPAGTDLVALLAFCSVFAALDPVWQGYLKATLQALYPGTRDLPCAMASFFTLSSIGIAVQQGVSLAVGGVVWECLIQFVVLVLGSVAPIYLHYRVASLDPRGEGESGGAGFKA